MTPLAYTIHGTVNSHGTSAQPTAPAVVLLHAYPLNSSMWNNVIKHLQDDHPTMPIITIDAPGFGGSPAGPQVAEQVGGPEEPALDTYALAIEATLQTLSFPRVVMVGLSLGGYAAMAYAEKFPDRLAGIGLLNTKAEADDEPARKVRLRTATQVLEEGAQVLEKSIESILGRTTRVHRPDIVEEVRQAILEAPPQAVAWIQHAMANRPNRLPALAQLDIPALVLRGEEDELAPPQSARAMAAALADTPTVLGTRSVVTLPEVGHMSALEAPIMVASAIEDLHSRVRA
ncbi:MAG TPA: alpha/beta hydrolase [Beutenbergiaceae bacterium]|nr:alpha/beta hydrolase [Beutenbergiaceae bacterium]